MKATKITCPITRKEIKILKPKSKKEYIEYLSTQLPDYVYEKYLNYLGITRIDYDLYEDEECDQWEPGFNPMYSPKLMNKLIRGRWAYIGKL